MFSYKAGVSGIRRADHHQLCLRGQLWVWEACAIAGTTSWLVPFSLGSIQEVPLPSSCVQLLEGPSRRKSMSYTEKDTGWESNYGAQLIFLSLAKIHDAPSIFLCLGNKSHWGLPDGAEDKSYVNTFLCVFQAVSTSLSQTVKTCLGFSFYWIVQCQKFWFFYLIEIFVELVK